MNRVTFNPLFPRVADGSGVPARAFNCALTAAEESWRKVRLFIKCLSFDIHDITASRANRDILVQNRMRRAILAVIGAARILTAQPNVANGDIQGTVTDPSAAVVVGAAVTLTSSLTGLRRTAATGPTGEFRLMVIPPGEYEVQIDANGLRSARFRDVRVSIGQITTLDARLELAVLTETLVIAGTPQLLDAERSHQSNTLTSHAVANLPIDRRDYLTFALLVPGVVDSTAIADNTDLRVKATPHSGISFFGSNGRGNSVMVDGGEANDGGGGVRSTLTQEAVQEFQINRSNYSAEIGGASGGAINIVSKGGTNDIHGSVFGFFRHQNLDAGNPFARVLENGKLVRTKPPAKRQQFGGTAGGPIRKDRTFFFAGFEGLVRRESSVVSILADTSIFDITPAQKAVIDALPAGAGAALRGALTTPQSTKDLFTQNSGVFPFTTDAWRFSLRLDHHASERDHLFFRHSYSDLSESNANLESLVGASRGSEVDQFDPTTAAGWTRVISPRAVNEARAQWNYRAYGVNSVDKVGPEIRIAGFGTFNHDYLLPSRTIERRYQLKDDFTWFTGSHSLKFGALALVRGTHSEGHVFFGGRFAFGDLPGAVLNPALPPSFTINALQSFNLGLAQTYIQGWGNPTVASTHPSFGFYAQDGYSIRPGLRLDIGLRYELDRRLQPLPTDTNNLAPRFALVWSPGGSPKTIVRAGYGIYYAPTYYQIDWTVNALNDINGRRQIAQAFSSILTPGPAAANNIFTTLRQQGVIGVPRPTRALTPAELAQFGVTFPQTGPLPPFTVLFQNSPDFVNPYSQQTSLSVERQLTNSLAVSIAYTYVRTLKIVRSRDVNLLAAPVDPALGIRVWSDPGSFVNPLVAQRNEFESTARAFYSGVILELNKRFSRTFSLHANYTFSRATDDVTDFNSDFQAADQANLRAERALSSFDQRHKFVAYSVWTGPGRIQFAPIIRANSGRPFNLLAGFDLNQDRHDTTDRPIGAGRNTGQGPNFWTTDIRVSREVAAGEYGRLELMVEAFNLMNRQNLASVNNIVGLMKGPFHVTGRADRLPTEPLGFTSVYDPRRVQLGVRLKF